MTEDSTKKTPEHCTKKTLEEQGPNMPIGILGTDGRRNGALQPGPWKLKQDKMLGKLREQNRGCNPFVWASIVLATLYEQFGPHDFSSMKLAKKRAIISQTFFGDVIYAWLWLRCAAIDNNLVFDFPCNRCLKPIEKFPADLHTVDVLTTDDVDAGTWGYELLDPIEIGAKKIERLSFSQPVWSPLESSKVTGGLNTAETKGALIQGALVTEENVVIHPAVLDELSKKDLELLTNEISDRHVGPDLKIEGECPMCERDFLSSIDWSYDSFFGVQSRS